MNVNGEIGNEFFKLEIKKKTNSFTLKCQYFTRIKVS